MPTQLTPQDMQFLSLMPQPGQVAGGINAFNNAAFGNPVAANPFGIVPTAPTAGIANPIAAAPMQQPRPMQQQNPLQQQPRGSAQQQILNMLRQRMAQAGGPRGAQAGGPGMGSTAAKEALSNFERENVAVHPSLASALNTAMVATGAGGFIGAVAGNALKSAFGVDGILGSAFNTPGPTLNQAAMNEVTKSFMGALNPSATNINQALATARATLDVERGLAGIGASMDTLSQGMGTAGLAGLFGGMAGESLIGGVDFGGSGSTGGGGLAPGGGGDTGGGMGGGVGGSGSSRNM